MAAVDIGLQTSELYGTSRLIDESGHGEKGDFILVPHPTTDPNDPLTWTYKRRGMCLAAVTFFTFFAGAIISGPVAGWVATSQETGITLTQLNYGYAISIMFLGVANIPWTIVANYYGRRPVYLACAFGTLLCCIWTAEYQNVHSYYAKSAIIGIFCAPYEGMVMTIVADLYFLHERGLYMALVFMHAIVGTDLGTIASAFISGTGVLNWRWCGWIGAMAFAVSFALLYFGFEETRFFRIAQSDPDSAASSTMPSTLAVGGDEKTKSLEPAADVEPAQPVHRAKTRKEKLALWSLPPPNVRVTPMQCFKEIMALFYYPAVVWAGCIYGINVSIYACVLSMLPAVIQVPPYNFTAVQLGLTRFGTIIGTLIALVLSGPLSDKVANAMARRNHGIREAEHRLPLFTLGLIVMPGACLIFGLCAAYQTHWIGVVFGEGLSSFGYAFTSELAMSYVVDCYRPVAIESMVGVVVIRNFYGFALTFAISPWLAASGVRNVSIALAVIAFGMYCLTLPMYMYGKRMRIWTSTRFPLAGRKIM
ncbi:hypothetical protein PV04_10763 [Phialophora macrospora]|uniref:Major facilitator superfamily (MFS) profile domain-containing protein n=1 Tax=Phialophora macrospora TaxID=1851006 RepID=A0A0D2F3Y3_9EURO|nr:hypothetical protein PV04_10763 [Phialophora macrospora]